MAASSTERDDVRLLWAPEPHCAASARCQDASCATDEPALEDALGMMRSREVCAREVHQALQPPL